MFHKLKRNFILLYTVTSAIILFITLFTTYIVWETQQKNHYRELFQNNLNQVIYMLSKESVISNTWLSEYEYKNKLIIHIEDNGIPFFFPGSYLTGNERMALIKKGKQAAAKEGIITNTIPISPEKSRSSVFTTSDPQHILYYGCVTLIPIGQSYKSLVLMQAFPDAGTNRNWLIFAIVLLGFLSMTMLYLLSCFIVKKALKPAQDSLQKQKEFIASASHELRAPLAVIQTSADSLSITSDKKDIFIGNIQEECCHMTRLISDMLLLASSDAKTWQIRLDVCDMDTFLIELYDKYFSLCKEQNHNFILELPETPLRKLTIDKQRLSQVLSILVDNALNYSPSDTTVSVTVCEKKNFMQIRVIDEGSGISDEEAKKIFNRFYRADKSRNEKNHYGLGLCIAQELVKLHNGTLSLEDNQEKGSIFLISLPIEL